MTPGMSMGPGPGNPRRWRWLLGIVGLLVFLAFGGYVYGTQQLAPLATSGAKSVVFRVQRGANVNEVATELKKAGLIRSTLAFHAAAFWEGKEQALKAGTYLLSPSLSVQGILKKMVDGDVAVHRVTIPEGFTVQEIAHRVGALTGVDAASFMTAADGLTVPLPQDAKVLHRSEGFLFPSTYSFPYGATAGQLAQTMNTLFDREWQKVSGLPRPLGMTEAQVVTLASIVQLEAKTPSDRAQVAAVFMNRIQHHMPLQSDVTVAYAVQKPASQLTRADFKVPSPYNTYVHQGLPPGPICNPGLAALKAVLEAPKTQNLYFVSKPSGGFIFSKTYKEQLQAERKVAAAQKKKSASGG